MGRYYSIPEGDDLIRKIRNPREEAIYDVLGGINAAAEKLGVRRQSVHYLLTQPRIRDTDTAKRLAEATEREGRPVPVAEILDLVPWRGPDRSGPGPEEETSRRGKGRTPSVSGKGAPLAAPVDAGANGAQTSTGSLKRPHKGRPIRACNAASRDTKHAVGWR